MNDLLRATLRDWIPPVIRRAVRRRLTAQPDAQEWWEGVRFGVHGLRLPDGRRFTYRSDAGDHAAVKKVFFEWEYSTRLLSRDGELQRFYSECERPLIIDAGAHIGAASVWFAMSYPRATVIAVEPHEGNFRVLEANVRAFPNVVPVRAALASKAGTMFLSDPKGGTSSDTFRTGARAAGAVSRVEAVTLADLVERAPRATPFICKLDIEGAGVDVFSAPPQLIGRFPLVVAELHDWMLPAQASSRDFLRWHIDQSRDLVTRGENVFSIAQCVGESVERMAVA